jgi:hypothetical protein
MAESAENAEKADQHGESSGDDNNHLSLLFWAAVRMEFAERVEKADQRVESRGDDNNHLAEFTVLGSGKGGKGGKGSLSYQSAGWAL